MKEFSFVFDKGLAFGLANNEKTKRNDPCLVEAYNVRIKDSILPYEAILNSFTGLPTCAWPFPQVFKTKRGIIVATDDSLYIADSNYNCTPLGTGFTSADHLWSVADFGDYQVFGNGACTVFRDTTTGTYSEEGDMTHETESVCNFNGQLVVGGLGTSRENWVAWSDIGSATLTSLLTPDQKNVRGFMPMDFKGSVLVVKQLGKGVMVYGTDGITYLPAVQATFGKQVFASYGIPGKGCVAGDDNFHLFIDSWNRIHIVEASLKHTILDYSNHIANLSGDIIITFDRLLSVFYISDGDRCYRYEGGLSEVFQNPSGIARVGASLIGVTYDSSDTSAYFTTNTFDMQTRAIKSVQTVEVDINTNEAQGAVDYTFKSAIPLARSRLKSINNHGVFVPIVAGIDLRVHVKATSYVDFSVDSLVVRYKLNDKRYIRGPYAESADM